MSEAYAGRVYESRNARGRNSVFRPAFILVVAVLFAMMGAGLAYLMDIPVPQLTLGGGLIGLGVGAVCWLIDRGGYS